MESIYRRIYKCIKEQGELPADFVVEERECNDKEIRFAPGALEGIIGHHTSVADENDSFIPVLKEYLAMEPIDAMEKFESEKAKDIKMATMRNGLLQSVYENRAEYDADKIARLAVCFAEYGKKSETVKLGLSLMSLFNLSGNEAVCNMLKTLGYCEEFTDYVINNTANWDEDKKQALYFELARKLRGWGKINVVEMMHADTAEKKEWLLCHGCKNDVMYAYLGYECAMKCDLYERLEKGNFSDEQFQGASDIMSGLLDEGPCQGMSALEYPIELTLFYLEECKKHNWDAEQVALLTDIASYFRNSEIENANAVEAKVKEALERLDIHAYIVENVEKNTHECMRIAKMYDLDMSKHLIRMMKMDFEKYYNFCYYLFANNQFVDEFLELCDREINYGNFPNAMGDDFGLGAVQGKIKLDMIVQHLDKYPGKGRKMIKTCLQSPITRWRNMAAKALLGWIKDTDATLKDTDAELYAEVERVYALECNEQTKGMWEKLLVN